MDRRACLIGRGWTSEFSETGSKQIEAETCQLWETVETIRTKSDAVVEILCKAGRQTSHHMGEVKSLVDELDSVNGSMTVDMSCTNCLQLMNDPSRSFPADKILNLLRRCQQHMWICSELHSGVALYVGGSEDAAARMNSDRRRVL
ncbi:hypothetical protein BLNAU_4785 [Blattamonas nauphoetae]|uniref:Uncharacterized protein n=1 Tax=Blattamonas nauphoetae TaxID=2049346 RepID=A0ABQ9Y924_9EUKA|nr:hypothetical protein BLNAU_4785 [Blattamonas nauphoetae]